MSETSLMMVCFKFVASCSETENSGLCISGQLVELYEIRCFCELLSCVKTFFTQMFVVLYSSILRD